MTQHTTTLARGMADTQHRCCREEACVFIIIIIIIYIRQSQQTEVFLLGALNDYEDARGKLAENRRGEWEGEASSTLWWLYS